MEQIKDGLNDKFMMNECNEFTRKMLEANININTICGIIKEYQTKYLYIKSQDKELAKQFTIEMWWKLRARE
tara:strand:- start:77 stop:292 length:216 start_codon:yes stop_codon:yes gene_type:complete